MCNGVRPLFWILAGMLALSVPASFGQADDQRPRPEKRGKGGGGKGGKGGKEGKRGGGDQPHPGRNLDDVAFSPEVAALRPISTMLGRPTDHSIAVNILAAEAQEALVEYGTASGKYEQRSKTFSLSPGVPLEVVLDELKPDTEYCYRLRTRRPGQAEALGKEFSFHTQRPPGRTFVFEIIGDSHPERSQQHDPLLYAQTLRAVAADKPDFFMTIGDDFSVDTQGEVTAENVGKIYRNQRWSLALVGQSAPIFLVNGNHEQAAAYLLDGTPNNVAVWGQTSRNRYFPQPAPDGFYTGDTEPVKHIGPLRDYYAWTWGDALFVVIDFYWHSPKPVDNVFGGGQKRSDMWDVTLGEAQYRWLQQTLVQSQAKHKFVFAHHVLGTSRGGTDIADLYEWGGKSKRGDNEFAQKRPGWAMPIHPLMAKTGVTIFFQGHDHIFVHQQLDGVTYQTLPEPADPNYALDNRQAYRTGEAFPNSGRVRVTVAPAKVGVEYVRSYLAKDATPQHPDGEVAFRYEVPRPH